MTATQFLKRFLCLFFLLVSAHPSWASHPLITDDTGTQGKGNLQLELYGQYDSDKEIIAGVATKSTGGQVATTLSYGMTENVDLVFSLPYRWNNTEEDSRATYNEDGIADMVLETKWRFFDKDGFSLALKPGIRIPTGNDKKGLGAGEPGGQLFFIASKELGAFALHANLGYILNENKNEERKNIWHASLATTWEAVRNLRLVANIGMERNPEESASNHPAFLIGGVIYSVKKYFDVDCGIKYGLTSAEKDFSLLAGITLRF